MDIHCILCMLVVWLNHSSASVINYYQIKKDGEYIGHNMTKIMTFVFIN